MRADAIVSGYNVYAFSGGANDSSFFYTPISSGQTLVYNTTNYNNGGIIIEIPANQQSGYLTVAGMFPITCATKNGSGWGAHASGSVGQIWAPSYVISSNLSYAGLTTNDNAPSGPFPGMIFVPAHTQTLYLYLFAANSSATYRGGIVLPNAFIQFLPDTDQSSTVLQQILTQITNIKNEITSSTVDNQYSQEIVDQMDDLLEQIEDLTQQIEDVTFRPPPDTILPSPPADLLPPVDPAGQLGFEAVTSILSLPLILSFLLMVFTLALIRYVLFGKSQ